MPYYEVAIADKRYQNSRPLIYASDVKLAPMTTVTVPLQNRLVTGFVSGQVQKPKISIKPIRSLISQTALPEHCFKLAEWLAEYYACSLGEALRQFAPTRPSVRRGQDSGTELDLPAAQLDLASPLTPAQQTALKQIRQGRSTTYLLHGDTGSGKTRVYLELAKECLAGNRSVILLTPEIALTSQLAEAARQRLNQPVYVLHSHLTDAQRKKIWLAILESQKPVIVIGPRSALFTPVQNIGLIVLDEAHEPAYKQEQNPRYHASRVASQLGDLTDAKVILGTATPLISDYFLAESHHSVVRLKGSALSLKTKPVTSTVVDIKQRQHFSRDYYLSNQLLDELSTTLANKKQAMIYLNRRGTARVIMCRICGWQLLCSNCDVPMIYHGDSHTARCHICGKTAMPPLACPKCGANDLHYKTIGTKALADKLSEHFSEARIGRYDSDNAAGERVYDVYRQLHDGEIDILVGTQLLAKGFDLPQLALVGIVSAETSLALPDFTSEERAFQLLYQVAGRVGRGHTAGRVVIQTFEPESIIIQTALKRDYELFYEHAVKQRQDFRFPPYAYLMKLICRRSSAKSAEISADNLRQRLLLARRPVEIVGPAPRFYAKRGGRYYWQLVLKSKNRSDLVELAKLVPPNWIIDIDPYNLL